MLYGMRGSKKNDIVLVPCQVRRSYLCLLIWLGWDGWRQNKSCRAFAALLYLAENNRAPSTLELVHYYFPAIFRNEIELTKNYQ